VSLCCSAAAARHKTGIKEMIKVFVRPFATYALIAALLIPILSADTQGANLILNGDFDGLSGWGWSDKVSMTENLCGGGQAVTLSNYGSIGQEFVLPHDARFKINFFSTGTSEVWIGTADDWCCGAGFGLLDGYQPFPAGQNEIVTVPTSAGDYVIELDNFGHGSHAIDCVTVTEYAEATPTPTSTPPVVIGDLDIEIDFPAIIEYANMILAGLAGLFELLIGIALGYAIIARLVRVWRERG